MNCSSPSTLLRHAGALALGFAFATGTAATGSAAQVDLLLLTGQSNMVGQANTTATLPGNDPADAGIRYYYDVTNTAGSFADSSGGSFGPLTPWRLNASTERFGPEMSLGRDLDAALNNDVALLKVAIGGSNIARWQQGAIDYNRFVAAVVSGVTQLQLTGDTVNILGLAWLQGESDSINTARADAYPADLDAFFTALRSDLNTTLPGLGFDGLPLVLVEPADWKNGSNPNIATADDIAKVDQALIDFAANDPLAWHVSTTDFTTFGDGLIHFGAVDQITLGTRIADTVLNEIVPEPGAAFTLAGFLVAVRRRH